ncbi:membrane-spanning 4-domains subfamily A member 4A-like [Suricata suricatta]|uniref:Membrane spanning 4-domains A4A n=1 Tax=Suricata suricatta TaxID=37032 RepID=A0A673UG66_SURSU|nr:membrane-spanning 4-domains subfamily A member 4A-like [Suricata suricatta]
MATMHGQEETTLEAGPGRYQPEQSAVIQSHLWKRMPEKFMKGEPKVLGVVQILIATVNFSLEMIKMSATLTFSYHSHFVSVQDVSKILGPVMFIISGSLSVVAGVRTTKGLIQTSLALNIFSSVMAGAMLYFAIPDLDEFKGFIYSCRFQHRFESCAMAMSILASPNILVFLLNILEFFIALSLAAFGCKVTCCNPGGVVFIMPSKPDKAEAASPAPFTEL